MYPILKFQLNKFLDKKACRNFLNHRHAGLDFGAGIRKTHPQIRKKKINEYVDNFYKSHKRELEDTIIKFEKSWGRISDKFFNYVNTIFKNHPWPRGKYIGYLSIFPYGPRFLKNKTFQIFYQLSSRQAQHVVAHEMLHFMFYDYIERHFSSQIKQLSKDRVWRLSEIFDDIILQQKQATYPKHERLFKKYKKLWQGNKDIDEFLKKTLKNIKEDFPSADDKIRK